jgi:7-carboxy-7-deazaguanine synthase
MITQIIAADWYGKKDNFPKDENYLSVSEFFCDTIQGEGINIGHPAAFLRLQGCSLNCSYCDSREVWKQGSQYTFDELFILMDKADLPNKLKAGQHLVLTGGSPLLQQERLYKFILEFFTRYGFKPYIEMENECVVFPNLYQLEYVDCWNNSPKLSTSDISQDRRYKQDILQMMSGLRNSWFKFVIGPNDNWKEIECYYIEPGLIKKEQIFLMPEGTTREELITNRLIALNMAVAHQVRFTDRLHIWLWNKKTGC